MCAEPEVGRQLPPGSRQGADARNIEALASKFYRYLDKSTATAFPTAPIPGVHPTKGAYFTRGSGHNKYGGYTEDSASTRRCSTGWLRKSRTRPRILHAGARHRKRNRRDARWVSSPYGGCHAIPRGGAATLLREGRHRHFDYMRIRGFPFTTTCGSSSWPTTSKIFVVEQNRDAQLRCAADARDRYVPNHEAASSGAALTTDSPMTSKRASSSDMLAELKAKARAVTGERRP